MQTWRRFWRLSGFARGIVLEAASRLLATRVGLRVAGFQRCMAAVAWLTPAAVAPAPSVSHPELEFARAIARWQAAAARHLPFQTTCLDRSISLWWMLRRRGTSADLRIGARKENGLFEAHAWIELGGTQLDDASFDHRDFVPFNAVFASTDMQIR